MSAAAEPAPSAWQPIRHRIAVVVGALLCGFLVFIVQAYRLQIVLADEHLSRVSWQVRSGVTVRAPRGELRDRHFELLAGNAPAEDIAIDPRLLRTESPELMDQVRPLIAELELFDAEEWETWSHGPLEEVRGYWMLARGVAPQDAAALAGQLDELGVRGLIRHRGYRRFYPNGSVGARAIGFVDKAGEHGVAGLEQALDATLLGGDVEVELERDASRKAYLLADSPNLAAAAGNTIQVTIDRRIQQVADEELAAACVAHGAAGGVVVVSRPTTGEVLAMASYPPFDPNVRDVAPEGWANPVVASMYEPGSTGKIFTFAAALEEGVVTYDEVIDCQGGAARVGRFVIRDEHCHGTIAAWEVIRDSSNIGAMTMGMRMTQGAHRAYLAGFGFGARTSSGLPGEAPGVLAPTDPAWPQSQHATISYGYGFSVTPLQLNLATAAIANGGVAMHPMVIARVVSPTGTELHAFAPRERGRVVSAETAALVRDAMVTVVSREGTARRATVPGFQAAGKTGTARMLAGGAYSTDAYLALFTGFVPAHEPEFVITVMIERPDPRTGYYGGIVAAPVFSAVASRAMGLTGRAPEPEGSGAIGGVEEARVGHELPGGGEAEGVEGLEWGLAGALETPMTPQDTGAPVVPDFTGVWPGEALDRARTLGVTVAAVGTGRVVSQWPLAGAALTPGGRIVLTLEAP